MGYRLALRILERRLKLTRRSGTDQGGRMNARTFRKTTS